MFYFRIGCVAWCFLIVVASSSFGSDAEPRLRPDNWATPLISEQMQNWYKVDDLVYRSEQPDDKGMQELARFGIKRVLNLRNFHSDDDELKDSGESMTLYRVAMQAEGITDSEIIAALKVIMEEETPILIHCWHGSDRTGTVIALYRIIFQNWSRQAALDELINGGYGYHPIYKSIPNYILSVDLDTIRAGLKSP